MANLSLTKQGFLGVILVCGELSRASNRVDIPKFLNRSEGVQNIDLRRYHSSQNGAEWYRVDIKHFEICVWEDAPNFDLRRYHYSQTGWLIKFIQTDKKLK